MTAQQKPRGGSRPRLTHFEVRRGSVLRLRLAVADDALAEAGDELGALIKKIAPSTSTRVVAPPPALPAPAPGAITVASTAEEFDVSPEHRNDDVDFHARLRERLAEMFGSLCDTGLDDVLEIAREERARRADGGN